MGKKYLDVYAGFCLFESWDQNHIITPCIISLSSLINVKHLGTVDQNYNEELYSIWTETGLRAAQTHVMSHEIRKMKKKLSDLELPDFDDFPVWCWDEDEEAKGELDHDHVIPIRKEAIIYDGDILMMVRFKGVMADGTEITGIADVESPPPKMYPSPTFYYNGDWLHFFKPPEPPFVIEKRGHIYLQK